MAVLEQYSMRWEEGRGNKPFHHEVTHRNWHQTSPYRAEVPHHGQSTGKCSVRFLIDSIRALRCVLPSNWVLVGRWHPFRWLRLLQVACCGVSRSWGVCKESRAARASFVKDSWHWPACPLGSESFVASRPRQQKIKVPINITYPRSCSFLYHLHAWSNQGQEPPIASCCQERLTEA